MNTNVSKNRLEEQTRRKERAIRTGLGGAEVSGKVGQRGEEQQSAWTLSILER